MTRPWLLVCVLGLASPASAGPRTVLFGVEDPSSMEETRASVVDLGGEGVDCFEAARVCWADFPDAGDLPLAQVESLPAVRYAEQDRPLRPHAARGGFSDPEGTPECPDPWEMSFIEIGQAWSRAGGQGGGAPRVAVMDSGFLDTHEDLVGRVAGQYDYGMGDDVAEVEWSSSIPDHGTFMAGLIAANAEDGLGRTGVVPSGSLFLQKISDDDGHMYYAYAIQALADLVEGDLGARVLTYSLSNDTTIEAFEDAFGALGQADVLAVVVAANCGSPDCADADNDLFPQYPGNFPFEHVVTVAGLLPDGSFNPMSHHGLATVDLAAPGASICSLGVSSDADYYTADGTSYAGPLVGGVAALMLATYPDLTAPELARMLRASAVDTPELQALVSSGGALSAAGALATPMPRFDLPAEVVIDGTATWTPPLENAAAEADGTLLLFHDGQVEITASGEWEATAFDTGEEILLPDGSSHIATRPGALVQGALPAASAPPLTLELRALEVASGEASARIVARSSAADDLPAPHAAGEPDETGALAWHFALDAVALPSEGGDDDDGGGDGDGCTCRSADEARPRGAGLLVAGLLLVALARGRRASRPC